MRTAAGAVDTAERFWRLVDVYWPIAAAVFVLVVGGLLAIGLRFRSDAEDYPQGRHEWPALEYSYAALVAAVAAVLVYLTFQTMSDERQAAASGVGGAGPVPPGALTVDVTASQWAWRFDYPGGVGVGGDNRAWPTLVVPVGRPVYFRVRSTDVVHSFWLPERKFKVDAFPRRTSTATLVWPAPGAWRQGGRCNQFCGLYHTTMLFDVRALPAAQFDRWLAARRAAAGTAS